MNRQILLKGIITPAKSTACFAALALTAFIMPTMAQSPTLTVLHSFDGTVGSDGEYPYGGVIQATDGNLYGMTAGSGNNAPNGVIYKVTPSGIFTTLYTFPGSANPLGSLYQAADGCLYGTTPVGTYGVPAGVDSRGSIFKISTSGVMTPLYFFGVNGAANPNAALIQANDGNLYGTDTSDFGVFRITTGGIYTSLYSITSGVSGNYNGLIQGSDGDLYGSTSWWGGAYNAGSIVKISTSGSPTTLYSFKGDGTDGANPSGTLVQASDGNFYGTTGCTSVDSDMDSFGGGTVFKITPSGVLTTLHFFSGTGSDGYVSLGGLIQGNDGCLYGTTLGPGPGNGTIFKITTSGVFTRLYTFTGADGAVPRSGVIQGTDGNLYGTTQLGGAYNEGVVFRLNIAP